MPLSPVTVPLLGESTTTLPLAKILSGLFSLPTTLRRTVLARMRMSPWITITLPVQVPVLALLSARNLSAEILIGALESCFGASDGATANAGPADKSKRVKITRVISYFRSRSFAHARPEPIDGCRDHNGTDLRAWCPWVPARSLHCAHARSTC